MTELYARPDHAVVAELLPGIDQSRVSGEEALAQIAAIPGMVPVAINPEDGGWVYWADLGAHRFRDWQFLFTIQRLAQAGKISRFFASPVDVLRSSSFAEHGITPEAGIFHVSRCGSTLLAKALAQPASNIVINQGGPLQHGLWALLTENWTKPLEVTDGNLMLFRNLVLAMTRPRNPEENRAFLKFISWNTLYMDFVAHAFPNMKTIFLYRDAVEVIASVRKNTTAALEARGTTKGAFIAGTADALEPTAFLAAAYSNYFQKALENGKASPALVNYRWINGDRGLDILDRGLGYRPGDDDEAMVVEQFGVYSKDDSGQKKFRGDAAQKRETIAENDAETINAYCQSLLMQLDDHDRNLFPQKEIPAV